MKRDCPVCSEKNKEFLYSQKFNNNVISLMESYDVMLCSKCGFAFADKIPSQTDFDNYYAVMSKYEFDYKNGVVSDNYKEHFNEIVDFITLHLKNKKAHIMDIGCSTGCLLSLFKERGYLNLIGIDPSDSCIKAVKKLYSIDAQVNNILNYDTDKKYDLIILSAVLEHIVDFTLSMNKISSLLREDGLLFVEVPDAERFDSYIFTPFQQFSTEHINYFSQISLANLMKKSSFEVIDMKRSENRIIQTIDPNLSIMAKKNKGITLNIVRDGITGVQLKKYIEKSLKMDLELKKIIKDKISNKEKIIVWGIGTHTQRLIGSGLDLSKILYFVDSNIRYKGKNINGIEVKMPADIKENVPILISTYSYQNEIADQIRSLYRLNNEIIKIY